MHGSVACHYQAKGVSLRFLNSWLQRSLRREKDEEVSEDDNYPDVYKQLKKAGNGPKEILVMFLCGSTWSILVYINEINAGCFLTLKFEKHK